MHMHWATTILLGSQLANAIEFLRPAAPLITGNLAIRQADQCPAMQTACPDKNGCCPSGAPCTYIMGQPRCAMACNGGPQCLGGGCCEIGYFCDLTTDLCHPIETGPPMPSLTSFNPGGPIITSTPVVPTSAWGGGGGGGSGGSAPSSVYGGGGSGGETSSSAAATPTQSSGSPTESAGGSSGGAAVPTGPAPGVASSLSMEWESWMGWVFACAAGLPLLA